ncbi:HAMP domain-containing protein [Stutzerimonas stutzeri]|nr:HAMP domain-containing protein [Stutzerimonas stutzeri]MCQ4320217.1 HAMP domain-containing protein [Stutzerimonas stutzeri]
MLARSLSGPMSALAQAAQRVGRGDYHTPIELDRE